MDRENPFLKGFSEKYAAWTPLKDIANHYTKTVGSVGFKAKKALGYGLIAAGGAAYGAHKLTKQTYIPVPPNQ